jgi:MFS family permease
LGVTDLTFRAAVLVALSLFGSHADQWEIRRLIFAASFGVGRPNLPVQIPAFASVSSDEIGHATAIFNMVWRASPTAGAAVLSTILAASSGHRLRPEEAQFHTVFLACAFIAMLRAAFALFIKDTDAAATMGRRDQAVPAERIAAATRSPVPSRGRTAYRACPGGEVTTDRKGACATRACGKCRFIVTPTSTHTAAREVDNRDRKVVTTCLYE